MGGVNALERFPMIITEKEEKRIQFILSNRPSYEKCLVCTFRTEAPIDFDKERHLWGLYNGECIICGISSRLEKAHIQPKSVIICNSIFNLTLTCREHHACLHRE